LLLRLIEGVAEGVAGLGTEGTTEGSKTRFDAFSPIRKVVNGVGGGVISSKGDTFRTGFACVKFEGVESGSVEVVGDSVDLFELIVHGLRYSIYFIAFNFIKYR
jgi:hypothetical protein